MAMRKRTIAILALAVMLVAVAMVALTLTPPSDQIIAQTSEQEQIDQLWKDGEGTNLFGPFNYSDGMATGKFIEFNYSVDDGAMTDVRMNTTNGSVPVISSLSVAGLSSAMPNVTGPLFRVDGNNASLFVHNNPTGLIAVPSSSPGMEIDISFADGAEIERSSGTQVMGFNISVNGVELWLGVSNANVDMDGERLLITFDDVGAMIMLQRPMFESVGAAEESEIVNAIGNGLIGSEVWVLGRDNGYVNEVAVLNSVDTNITAAEPGLVTLEASASFQGGSIIVVNVDKETIDPNATRTVTVNDEEAENADIATVLSSASSGNASSSFAMLDGVLTTKFLVYVPDLSNVSTITIENT